MVSSDLVDFFVSGKKKYKYFSVNKALPNNTLPASLNVLLENVLRQGCGDELLAEFVTWQQEKTNAVEIPYQPSRVLMQDFTGVPAVVDLAAMRDAMLSMQGDPSKINPLCQVDLVIDHSIQVDKSASADAVYYNAEQEMQRNKERYALLNWAQQSFENFRVVPPGRGICHQVNLEYLANVVGKKDGVAFPDTLVGTDSHTTMVNALGVLGWGVGGIEAEAAMLGQPIALKMPDVIGVYLHGEPDANILATDIVLTITQKLRSFGVVNKFVEFFGPGLEHLTLADRATIANMAPEYGSTCGFFPIDEETLSYLKLTSRSQEQIELIRQYSKLQGIWHNPLRDKADYSECVDIDLAEIAWSVAGPLRPQDRVCLSKLKNIATEAAQQAGVDNLQASFSVADADFNLKHGDIVIAAITSCTNTSNPEILIAAGLLAKAAVKLGLKVKPWVKTSFAPGSRVVQSYLEHLGLLEPLEQLGFHIVGYGCTTCIGNSGPLAENIAAAIEDNKIYVAAALSGNRNFAGRIHQQVQANWLASPPLVVAFALAGSSFVDFDTCSLGMADNKVMLADIWPTAEEINSCLAQISSDMFVREYGAKFWQGPDVWQKLSSDLAKDRVESSMVFNWQDNSTYIRCPSFFKDISLDLDNLTDISNAAVLAVFGDSVTTDHISPAGNIALNSPAGSYLSANNIAQIDFNSYGARRGNHEVMMRGTFANIRIKNLLLDNIEGGYTLVNDEILSMYDAAMSYKKRNIPLVIFAGKEYGTGSSRDWAAKGTGLLGVKCVIAQSFERIHRSNLIGMGVLPIKLECDYSSLELSSSSKISILGIKTMSAPNTSLQIIVDNKGHKTTLNATTCIDTPKELEYFTNQGILTYMLRKFFIC
jgi:aconitate hydratase